ncbi:MAG: class I SAM-dependent methyltransferase [bacterium]
MNRKNTKTTHQKRISTRDFVKKTGRDKIWKEIAKELKLLHDENGDLKKELRRYVKCALCDTADTQPVFVKDGFQFVKCRQCGLIYVNPQVNPKKLVEINRRCRSHDMWVDLLLSQTEQDYDTKKFNNICGDLERLLPGRGRVLDIGCSIGLFLKIARSRGWDTVGMELNTKAVRYAREKLKLDVRECLLHEAGFEPESFDVITLWEVLEHVPDPASLLEECRGYLRKGGLLGLLVPNRNALSAMILHEHCSCFGGRNHLWYFSKEVLSALLIKKSFKPIHTDTQLSQMEEILNYLNYRDPYLSAPDPFDFSLPDKTKKKLGKFIFENHLGYKLLMYARKK